MEEFLGMTNVADLLSAGEKAFEAGLYDAAKLLFTSISNWARLATTLIYLGENQAAVDAARKAGNTQFVILLDLLLFLIRNKLTRSFCAQ
jgi:clathrin heavy chain